MATWMKQQKRIPYPFVLEILNKKDPIVRPMFGCYAIYVEGKIVLILRDRESHSDCNGVWIATSRIHHERLKKIFPSMQSISVLGEGVTNWQMLPASDDNFERLVTKACEMILQGDERIGKVPDRVKRASSSSRRRKSARRR